LRVYVQSTQGDPTQRTQSAIIIQNYTLANGTVIPLMPTPTVPLQCISYGFQTIPGVQVTGPLLNYWQNLFSGGGWSANGCITVTDQYGTIMPGLPLPSNSSCSSNALCNFQSNTAIIANQTQLNIAYPYLVCPVPYPVCSTDPVNYSTKISQGMSTLSTNTSFVSVLNIQVVPSYNLTVVSDAVPPTLPSFSALTATSSGQITFTLTSNNPVSCYYMASTSTIAPLPSSLTSCTGSFCGNTVVPVAGTPINANLNVGTSNSTATYNLFAVCYNNVPCPTTATQVVSVGSTTLSASTINSNGTSTVVIYTCPSGQGIVMPSNTSCQNCSSTVIPGVTGYPPTCSTEKLLSSLILLFVLILALL